MSKLLNAHVSANKRYRAKYPEKRKIERQKNYASTAGAALNRNHRTPWTIYEMHCIKNTSLTDRELHWCLGRSVQAIQAMRHKLKKI